MKWKTESREMKRRRLNEWRPWFAWFPVKVAGGAGKPDAWAWLCSVERRWEPHGGLLVLEAVEAGIGKWAYRLIEDGQPPVGWEVVA